MRCDSWDSLLACNLASLCLGHEPMARVVIGEHHIMTRWWSFSTLIIVGEKLYMQRWERKLL
jgi:hypothetical protein